MDDSNHDTTRISPSRCPSFAELKNISTTKSMSFPVSTKFFLWVVVCFFYDSVPLIYCFRPIEQLKLVIELRSSSQLSCCTSIISAYSTAVLEKFWHHSCRRRRRHRRRRWKLSLPQVCAHYRLRRRTGRRRPPPPNPRPRSLLPHPVSPRPPSAAHLRRACHGAQHRGCPLLTAAAYWPLHRRILSAAPPAGSIQEKPALACVQGCHRWSTR